MSLSEESRKKFEEYYLSKIPACNQCGSNENVIHSIIGKPSHELYLFVQEHPDKLRLGGCCSGGHSYECKTCNRSFSEE